ncbi:type II secretion system minor pseudopilin GspI, partial [Marinobacter alexandrii]|uniref:type II secretion system minor pseudopilin GspI n=1 Tax=Marinobacter alexandrii TaxID=2570351 RepID=UPI003299581D
MTRPKLRGGAGFTLVEVMVALAIVAIALPALLFTLYNQVDTTAYLRDKSMAQLVAVNKMTEVRLVALAQRELSAGREVGSATLADREWFWTVESTPTEVPQFFRVMVSVGEQEDSATAERGLYSLVAYLSADLRVDATPLEESGDAQGAGESNDGQD